MSLFSKNEPPPYDLSNLSVMLVEDSMYMQSLMTSMLKVFGVGDIITCEDSREAIDLLTITQARRKSRYITDIDIVLTDWLMPKGSGGDLLKWIRSSGHDPIRFLPVIVVSGYTTETVISIARDMGANETLVKPVSGTGLASRICAVIDQQRPFVDILGYFGPDRRRQDMVFKGSNRRVMQAEKIKVIHDRTE